MKTELLLNTDCPGIGSVTRGKVRDVYDLGELLLIVTTDRISVFDVILQNGVPGKGYYLNQIALFWFKRTWGIIGNHIVSDDVSDFPEQCRPYHDQLEGRSILVRKADILPIEGIVRGYLTGSGKKDYDKTGAVCGIQLPPGLVEASRLPEPIFTPSTKAQTGMHDENISFKRMAEILDSYSLADTVRETAIALYKSGSEYAEVKGIIIADTKFEFGIMNGGLVLADEILTPDSSRFWPREKYVVGQSQESLDKQIARDWAEKSGWDKKAPGPALPPEIVDEVSQRYKKIYEILTTT